MPPRVLICDDVADMRELVRVVLGDGYVFHEAGNGVDAVRLAQETKPDLVILDMMIPGLAGVEVLRQLREDPATASIPVLALTAWHFMAEEVSALGVEHFVVKPFDPEDLRRVVASLVGEEGRGGNNGGGRPAG
jgi:CheY-like chemotaxis protein